MEEGLPWWSCGWEFALQCGDHQFNPWSGKIPYAAGQLSPHTVAGEYCLLQLEKSPRSNEDSA